MYFSQHCFQRIPLFGIRRKKGSLSSNIYLKCNILQLDVNKDDHGHVIVP